MENFIKSAVAENFGQLLIDNEHNEWVHPKCGDVNYIYELDKLYLSITVKAYRRFFTSHPLELYAVHTNKDFTTTFQLVLRNLRKCPDA